MKSPFFIQADDSRITYVGQWKNSSLPGTKQSSGAPGEFAEIAGVSKDIYGIFHMHDWSGIVDVQVDGVLVQQIDLFSPYPQDRMLLLHSSSADGEALGLQRRLGATSPPLRLISVRGRGRRLLSLLDRLRRRPSTPGQGRTSVRIVAAGRRNPLSNDAQVVFRGFDSTGPMQTGDQFVQGGAVAAHSTPLDPTEFAALQKAHVDRWRAIQGANYDAVAADRVRRYVQKYKRASHFFGERLFDVGSGYVPGEILDMLVRRGVHYECLDIDERVTSHMAEALIRHGLKGCAHTGEIGTFELSAASYDTIFASHSIEHSSSIPHSLQQVFTGLKPRGHLIMTVPVGWDDSEEHVNCYGVDEWLAMIQQAGFDILSHEVGKLYDPLRHDLTVVATRPA